MATKVGSLIAAIGTKMASTFTGFSVVYGLPDSSGSYGLTGAVVFVHYREEKGEFTGSQLGGSMLVQPVISVTVARPFTGTSTALASEQSRIDLGADLRAAIGALVMDHVMGTAPIADFTGQALFVTEYASTPSCIDLGTGQSMEAVTVDFTFKFSSTYGSR